MILGNFKKVALLYLSSVLAIAATAQSNGTETIRMTDMLKIKTAGNISLTKDGSRAAFTVTSIVADEKNKSDYKYETQIYTVTTDGTSVAKQLTFAKEGGSSPMWSPNGKQLAFVRTVDEKQQVFLFVHGRW